MTEIQPMMKFRFLSATLFALCLTSCASYEISQPKLGQIRAGVTTQADLLQLFGPPDTEWTAFRGNSSLDWYRSEGPNVTGYLPIVGQFAGGLDFEIQQLSVTIGPNGRVLSYSLFDSNGAVKADQRVLREIPEGVYRK